MTDTDELRDKDEIHDEIALTEEDLRNFLEAGTYEEQVTLLHLHSAKNRKMKERKGGAEGDKERRKSKGGAECK